MDDLALEEQLSAYADGELEEARAATVTAALEEDPSLRRVLEQFREMDRRAAALPVPDLDEDTGAALWELVAERTLRRHPQSGPDGTDEAADRLAEGAEELPAAPQVADERWAHVWQTIRARTAERAASSAAPGAAAPGLPLGADLTPVNQQAVALDGLEARSGAAAAPRPRPRAISIWQVAGLMAVAAALVAMATLGIAQFPRSNGDQMPPTDVAEGLADEPEGAEVLDDRYVMLVKHLPGLDEPVVCFVLNE